LGALKILWWLIGVKGVDLVDPKKEGPDFHSWFNWFLVPGSHQILLTGGLTW